MDIRRSEQAQLLYSPCQYVWQSSQSPPLRHWRSLSPSLVRMTWLQLRKQGRLIVRLLKCWGWGRECCPSAKYPDPFETFDWRSEMNIKSLLLGSAAALAAVSGAQAADAIVAAEPEPMEYVRVCDAFGTGYFYIPGTETCLKIGGYVRFQTNFVTDDVDGTSDWDTAHPRSAAVRRQERHRTRHARKLHRSADQC